MFLIKKSVLLLSVLGVLFASIASSQAAIVSTSEILIQSERTQLVNMLERKDVQQQLIELGVDPESSLMRVEQMTDEELAQLKGQLGVLPAGIGTTNLLLIIILLVLLI
jgi:hypothetical protein